MQNRISFDEDVEESESDSSGEQEGTSWEMGPPPGLTPVRLCPPTPASSSAGFSQRPMVSPEPSDQRKRAHNLLGLELSREMTATHFGMLKDLFKNNQPLSAEEHEKITTFSELWNTLEGYRFIKPGDYTNMERALGEIRAQSCLVSLRRLKERAFANSGSGDEVERLKKALEDAKKESENAENQRRELQREKSAIRLRREDLERMLHDVLANLDTETALRKQAEEKLTVAERHLQDWQRWYQQQQQPPAPARTQVQIILPNH